MAFNNILLRFSIYLATRRPVPSIYSTSSESKVTTNFSWLYLKYNDARFKNSFLVKSTETGRGVKGVTLEKQSTNAEKRPEDYCNICLDYKNLGNPEVSIRRIYGSQSLVYDSIISYILGEITLRHWRLHWREIGRQKIFEKRFRFSAERISTLKAIYDWQCDLIEQKGSGSLSGSKFSAMDAYHRIYSARAFSDPKFNLNLAKLELTLDSLVESEDLKNEHSSYSLNGKAISTLSDFEAEDRRARASERTNKIIMWLTGITAFAAILQSLSK